jgi:hypothetical protein
MKNIFIVAGLVFIVINTLAGMLVTEYMNGPMMIGNISIVLSTVLIYATFILPIADGYKIGYSFLFSLSGFLRLVCCFFIGSYEGGNIALFLFIAILMLEILLLFISYSIRNK